MGGGREGKIRLARLSGVNVIISISTPLSHDMT